VVADTLAARREEPEHQVKVSTVATARALSDTQAPEAEAVVLGVLERTGRQMMLATEGLGFLRLSLARLLVAPVVVVRRLTRARLGPQPTAVELVETRAQAQRPERQTRAEVAVAQPAPVSDRLAGPVLSFFAYRLIVRWRLFRAVLLKPTLWLGTGASIL
jgi:hypothetical protein